MISGAKDPCFQPCVCGLMEERGKQTTKESAVALWGPMRNYIKGMRQSGVYSGRRCRGDFETIYVEDTCSKDSELSEKSDKQTL